MELCCVRVVCVYSGLGDDAVLFVHKLIFYNPIIYKDSIWRTSYAPPLSLSLSLSVCVCV